MNEEYRTRIDLGLNTLDSSELCRGPGAACYIYVKCVQMVFHLVQDCIMATTDLNGTSGE